jgi:Ca2+-binding EF-hand superfamily protein|eukprot:SAG25_NODE_200_length_12050_cov_3.693247_8_plen_85_part_00
MASTCEIDPATKAKIKAIFVSHAAAETMTVQEFTDTMVQLGAKREYCTQYFKAFDRSGSGRVDEGEFLLGAVAMDNQTYHGGHW